MTSIGFHVSNGGNMTGIGDYMRQLDTAGIPFGLISIGNYGPINEGVLLMRQSNGTHNLVFRVTDLDVPNYALDPATAALTHWGAVKAKLPPEFDKQRVWICPINEVDKNRADWLGNFATTFVATAMGEGYKVTMFAWSSGEPEPDQWKLPGMKRYLELCAINPTKAAVALHEYSFTIENLNAGYPDMIGRFQQLFAACDSMGIARPTVHISEFGWTHEEVPAPDIAMPQIAWAHSLYSQHPQIKMATIWYLGNGFGGIANLAQKLIEPVTTFMINAPPSPIPPPPTPSTYKHVRLIAAANIRVDPTTNKPPITPNPVMAGLELIKVGNVAGQPVSGNGNWVKAAGFISRSYVTDIPGGKVRTNRAVNLRIVPSVSNNWPIITLPIGVEFESLGNIRDFYNAGWWCAVALYVWQPLTLDVTPEIRLDSPLKIPLTITSPFNAPRSYPFAPDKIQRHEGEDWHTGGAIPVLTMQAGVVDSIQAVDPGFGYGLRVRIKHSNRYSSWYGHLSQIQVSTNQVVAKGQQIALSGRSGNSVHHLHCTVQDIPTGLDGYVIDDCHDFTLLMHPAVNLSPVAPPVPEPGSKVDLLPYFLSSPSMGVLYEVQTEGAGQQRHQTQIEGNVFFHTKDREWEQLKYDTAAIYRGIDTSPGNGQYYRLSDVGNPSWSKWAARHMAVGEIFERRPTIAFARKSDCAVVSVSTAVNYLKLNAVYPLFDFFTGIRLANVIELEWRNTPNGAFVEKYFYSVGFGLCGWQSADGRRAAISEIHPAGSRPNNIRESGCFG